MKTPKIKAIDFFCGAGGLTRGLLNAGIAVLGGVDYDERLRLTYESNNVPSRFVCQDIESVRIGALREQLQIGAADRVLYAACTPCQPFSTLNQRRGKDDRKSLLLSFGEIVRESPPDFIVVENVPGLNNAYGKEVYESFIAILDECELFHRSGALLDAKDYGVPQIRRRFIMLASRVYGAVNSTQYDVWIRHDCPFSGYYFSNTVPATIQSSPDYSYTGTLQLNKPAGGCFTLPEP